VASSFSTATLRPSLDEEARRRCASRTMRPPWTRVDPANLKKV
jgi:hypothetical protein